MAVALTPEQLASYSATQASLVEQMRTGALEQPLSVPSAQFFKERAFATGQVATAGVGGVTAPAVAAPELAGIPAALAAIPASLAALGISLPASIVTALGLAGAGYGVYQALGGGEGGGLFGTNILGGDESVFDGVPFGGPGLPEPLLPYKEWHITTNGTTLQFYRVSTERGTKMFCYNTKTKKWTTWRPQKMAVIGKNMPGHRTLFRLRHYLAKQSADAKTILKITSPKSLRQPHHRYYHKRG